MKILIAGAGPAGLSALKMLAKVRGRLKKDIEILLIDKKQYSEFLPMLPDVAGGWLRSELLKLDLASEAERRGAEFLQDEIEELDLVSKAVKTFSKEIKYDHLILATGSETNYFGNDKLQKQCYDMDDVDSAVNVREKVSERAARGKVNIVIVGGGYTGIELAGNLKVLLRGAKEEHKVYIVEKAEEVLMMLPEWMRGEIKQNVKSLEIEILSGDSLSEYDGSSALLSSGKRIENAFCVWAAGVKTPAFIEKLDLKKERSRIVVDKSLQPAGFQGKNVYACGDAAHFDHTPGGKPLRMAVMFSMAEGKVAAKNIIRSIRGKSLIEYKPVDLGYLIPVANGRAPGVVLGVKVHGLLGYMMHYFMCVYRSAPSKRAGIIKDIFFKLSKKKGD